MLAAAVLLVGVVPAAADAECPAGWVETEYAKTLGGRRDTEWCNDNCKKEDGTLHLACDAVRLYDMVVWEDGDDTDGLPNCGGSTPGKCPYGKKCWRCWSNNGDGRICPRSATETQYYCHARCKGEAPGRQNNGGDCPPKCKCPRSTPPPTASPTSWPTKPPTKWLDQYITMGGPGAAGFELGLVGVLPGKDCGLPAEPPKRSAKILGHLSHSSSPFVLEAASFKGDVDFTSIQEYARNGVVAEIRAVSGATPTFVPANTLSFTMRCDVAEQCDAFIFVYHDPPSSGSTNGGFSVTLLENDAWEAASCAPSFRCESVGPEAETCKFHMVAFKKTLAQGQTVEFPVSNPLMFALFMVVPKVPCQQNTYQTEEACSATHSCDTDPKVTSTCVYSNDECADSGYCASRKTQAVYTGATTTTNVYNGNVYINEYVQVQCPKPNLDFGLASKPQPPQ